jgi:hypothetical protein
MQIIKIISKFLVITVTYLVTMMIGEALLASTTPQPPQEQMGAVMLGLLITAVVDAAMIIILIIRSRWSGLKLMGTIAFSLYGVMTFMAIIEAAYFGPALGIQPEWLPGMFASSIPAIVITVPLAVWIFGKAKLVQNTEQNERLIMPARQWVWKMALVAFAYLVLYTVFGSLVFWAIPALRDMYGGGVDPAVFNPGKMLLFQILRSMLWVVFGAPVIRMTVGKPLESAVILGLLFALPMNIVHFTPNSIMPDSSVRLAHFIETATSNFIFGMIVFWLLHRRHWGLRDLFGLSQPSKQAVPNS